jgi:glycosyltransferase involved in cell wall biosynthesis
MQLSVVVPLHDEEENVGPLADRLREALGGTGLEYEILLVDDGSRDGTAARLGELAAKDPRIRPVYLVRNYGQSTALQAGFDAVRGDVVATLDGDLQNDPADLPGMIARARDE